MPSSLHKKNSENTCIDCLYFQRDPKTRHARGGNCTYHKEWIPRGSSTTCSDMSGRPLMERGIYTIIDAGAGGWLYVRRQGKIRTRLFSVK